MCAENIRTRLMCGQNLADPLYLRDFSNHVTIPRGIKISCGPHAIVELVMILFWWSGMHKASEVSKNFPRSETQGSDSPKMSRPHGAKSGCSLASLGNDGGTRAMMSLENADNAIRPFTALDRKEGSAAKATGFFLRREGVRHRGSGHPALPQLPPHLPSPSLRWTPPSTGQRTADRHVCSRLRRRGPAG